MRRVIAPWSRRLADRAGPPLSSAMLRSCRSAGPLVAALLVLACSRAPVSTHEAEVRAISPQGDHPTPVEDPPTPPPSTVDPDPGTSAVEALPDEAPPIEVPSIPIVDRPITYDDARTRLTVEYRRRHESADATDTTIAPRMMVLHHTGGSSLDAAWRYFDRIKIEAGRETLAKAGDLNVSAHFLVDRDGTIVRLMPETTLARHCVGLNHVAIGVENVGDGKAFPLTQAQIDANAALIRHLAARFPLTHVIGHHESLQMQGHPYFQELEAGYRTRKGDPGPAFMTAVRAQIADLGLEGPPPAKK